MARLHLFKTPQQLSEMRAARAAQITEHSVRADAATKGRDAALARSKAERDAALALCAEIQKEGSDPLRRAHFSQHMADHERFSREAAAHDAQRAAAEREAKAAYTEANEILGVLAERTPTEG